MADTAEALELQLELRDLKNALTAMRERLETVQGEHAAALVRAVSGANAENTELRNTIAALREQLEIERAHHDQAASTGVAQAQDE